MRRSTGNLRSPAAPRLRAKAPRRRKDPLRHQEEYEQEGFVSFFEKK